MLSSLSKKMSVLQTSSVQQILINFHTFDNFMKKVIALYTRNPIVARLAWPSARVSKGILHTETSNCPFFEISIKLRYTFNMSIVISKTIGRSRLIEFLTFWIF